MSGCRAQQAHARGQQELHSSSRAQESAAAENRILLQSMRASQEELRISKACVACCMTADVQLPA